MPIYDHSPPLQDESDGNQQHGNGAETEDDGEPAHDGDDDADSIGSDIDLDAYMEQQFNEVQRLEAEAGGYLVGATTQLCMHTDSHVRHVHACMAGCGMFGVAA